MIQRGPIDDVTPLDGDGRPSGPAYCRCPHGAEWGFEGGHVKDHVEPGSALYTDTYLSYRGLEGEYAHRTVDHAERYVDGRVHTNGLENFWSLLKRGLHGTYVRAEPFHLFRYLDERVFTYNMRDAGDYGRFETVLRAVAGRRLTYSELTGKGLARGT